MDWNDARYVLNSILNKHSSEAEKVIQKLLALALVRSGYAPGDEGTVQGINIEGTNEETGKKLAFAVKISKSLEIIVDEENVEELKTRKTDGYETLFAVLCMPICFSEGWIVSPSERFKAGRHKSIGFLRRRDEDLSGELNDAFLEVLDEIGDAVLKCGSGDALRFLEERY
jgi:hypothetical protein